MRSCPRYRELLHETTEAVEYQTALEGWAVSRPAGRAGVGWRAARLTWPVLPGLPDLPGELHGAVAGRGAAPQGLEGSRHTDVPGEPLPHPPAKWLGHLGAKPSPLLPWFPRVHSGVGDTRGNTTGVACGDQSGFIHTAHLERLLARSEAGSRAPGRVSAIPPLWLSKRPNPNRGSRSRRCPAQAWPSRLVARPRQCV